MSFISGKLGFHLMKAGASSFKPYDSMIESIKFHHFKPMEKNEEIQMCFVNCTAEIDEDFEKELDNYGDRQYVLFDVLIQTKKPNPKVVARRLRKELYTQTEMMKSLHRDWKPDKEFRKRIKEEIQKEELLKAQPTNKRVSFAIDIENGYLMINAKSPSVVEKVSAFIASVCMEPSDDSASVLLLDLISNAAIRGYDKLQPFSVSPWCASPPDSGESYIMEFITWLFCRSLDDDDSKIQCDDWAKVHFAFGDKNFATLKTNESPDTLGDFGVVNILGGGLLDEAKMFLYDSEFAGDGCISFKIDHTGYISNIDFGLSKDMKRDDPTLVIQLGLVFYKSLKKESDKFFNLRQKPTEWSVHAAQLRSIIKERASYLGIKIKNED